MIHRGLVFVATSLCLLAGGRAEAERLAGTAPATARLLGEVRPGRARRAPVWAAGQASASVVVGRTLHALFPFEPTRRPARRWIRYEVAGGETLRQVARRFGVTTRQLLADNRLRRGAKGRYAGKRLRILARRFPPYRTKLIHRVRRGESWATVARTYNVSARALRRHNRRAARRPLRAGTSLAVWLESDLPRWGKRERGAAGQEPIHVAVPIGARSVGYPAAGGISGSVPVPESPLYTLVWDRSSYASTSTMAQLQRGVAAFRRRSGFRGKVRITSMSKRRGGRLAPHRSHQSGRDVDFGFLTFAALDGTGGRPKVVDWAANWLLLREFIATGQVERVFLDYGLQKKMRAAAASMGASDAELREAFQYPRGKRSRGGVIRHAAGHADHFHVRWRCGPAEPRCR